MANEERLSLIVQRRRRKYETYFHPELAIAQTFKKGRYLELPQNCDSAQLPMTPRMRRLIEKYRGHIASFGNDSLAHLCLPELNFDRLTNGVFWLGEKFNSDSTEDLVLTTLNTINELRSCLSDPHSLRVSWSFRRVLKVKLAEWDAIPEELPNSPVST